MSNFSTHVLRIVYNKRPDLTLQDALKGTNGKLIPVKELCEPPAQGTVREALEKLGKELKLPKKDLQELKQHKPEITSEEIEKMIPLMKELIGAKPMEVLQLIRLKEANQQSGAPGGAAWQRILGGLQRAAARCLESTAECARAHGERKRQMPLF